MADPGMRHHGFASSAALQEYLLTLPPGGLVLVPQMRLAHQVWRRQRLAAREARVAAWEPVAMTTLGGWWRQLWRQAWLPQQPASRWQRLCCWRRILEAFPFQGQVLADLTWAALLDEAYDLLQRYQLPRPEPGGRMSPLIAWRETVFQEFAAQMAGQGLLTAAMVPAVLSEALAGGKVNLPDYLVVVGLETPAPAEEQWLQAVARRRPVVRLQLWGRGEQDLRCRAVVLPDRHQEMAWVAAQVLEQAQHLPLHRVAITAANLEDYLPDLRRIFQELLGPAATVAGGRYNFSLGPTLAASPLFQAAFLPLRFRLEGESRRDLLAWLQSPYYGVWREHQKRFLQWDLLWRQHNLGYGWAALRHAAQKAEAGVEDGGVVPLLDQALELLPGEPVPISHWQEQLSKLWRLLAFPTVRDNLQVEHWRQLQGLLAELAASAGDQPWPADRLWEWLSWGAAHQDLPGEGTSEAGIQVQGLLELRGLDYEVIFCLGLNMGVFPPPPRILPLLTFQERAAVLGGTFTSQHRFAEIAYRYLQAAAPHLILTRPLVYQEEEQIASQLIAATEEEKVTFVPLSHRHQGWLRSPAVQAAFRYPQGESRSQPEGPVPVELPAQISLTALERALACPCWFFLSDLLGLQPLAEAEVGLPAQVRGQTLHRVVFNFTTRFAKELGRLGYWQDDLAWQVLQSVIEAIEAENPQDPHWQAEITRWQGEEMGLLRRWLLLEKERYQQGWRWLQQEQNFGGLRLPGWPTALQGRLDRVDHHPDLGLMVWDYKTGEILAKTALLEEPRHFQLAGYVAAVQQRCVQVPKPRPVRAGIIGLKSIRGRHLKFEDYKLDAAAWEAIVRQKVQALAAVGAKFQAGAVGPAPNPPPSQRNGACRYCPFALLCGFMPAETEEAEA